MELENLDEMTNKLVFKTIGGRYGIQSHDEYDQVDGYFDTYEEAKLALIELIKQKQVKTP